MVKRDSSSSSSSSYLFFFLSIPPALPSLFLLLLLLLSYWGSLVLLLLLTLLNWTQQFSWSESRRERIRARSSVLRREGPTLLLFLELPCRNGRKFLLDWLACLCFLGCIVLGSVGFARIVLGASPAMWDFSGLPLICRNACFVISFFSVPNVRGSLNCSIFVYWWGDRLHLVESFSCCLLLGLFSLGSF